MKEIAVPIEVCKLTATILNQELNTKKNFKNKSKTWTSCSWHSSL